MREVIKSERMVFEGMVLEINASKNRGCYGEILTALKLQMDAFLSHHARMLFIRVDIRQYVYTEGNKPISDFMRKLKKKLVRKYKTARIGYLWVREMERAKQQHYHLVLMIDGKAVQYPAKVIEEVERIAENWGWPKPYTPKNCFYLIHRTDTEMYQSAFHRGSYLAKERGKGYKGLTAKNYGSSNIKPNPKKIVNTANTKLA